MPDPPNFEAVVLSSSPLLSVDVLHLWCLCSVRKKPWQMYKVRLGPLQTTPQVSQEERRCPRCGRTRVRLHGRRRRAIRDWVFREVQ